MEELSVIGWKKAVKFVLYEVFRWILRLSLLPPLRVLFLQLSGAKIGKNTYILDAEFINLYHYGFSRVTIGNYCYIGDGVSLDTRGGISMEDHVSVSNRVSIVTHMNVGYPTHPLQKAYPTREGTVTLKKGCYIGTGAIILPGITIGKESVVGAGAVVTRDVASRTVVGGVPARVIKKIT